MLSGNKIIKEERKGDLFITDFKEAHVNPNSYDLTLGHWFFTTKYHSGVVSLEDNDSVQRLWNEPRFVGDGDVIILEPHSFILAHTEEFVGSNKYATLLKARSTIARIGLDVCASAGFGDVGYVNRWTLEIKNNTDTHIILKPGFRVAQITFMKVEGRTRDRLYRGKGAYMPSCLCHTAPYAAQAHWKPSDMLPKLGKERI